MSPLASVEFCVPNMTDEMLAKFLYLNPQLEQLSVVRYGSVNSLSTSMLHTICTYSQNLEYLRMESKKISSLNILGMLQKLKSCFLHSVDSVDAVINAFAKGNVPIECLRLVGSRFSGENLLTINTLKILNLTIHNGFSIVSEILLRTQPALEDLKVQNEYLKSLMGHD